MGLLRLFLPRWARRLLWLVVVALVMSVVVGRLFVWPGSSLTRRADAIVMFQGGEGERLDKVMELLDSGVARVAIIPEGHFMGLPELCGPHDGYEIVCGSPAVATTAGEAAFFAAVAELRGYDTLAFVTSSYHVSRAGHELRTCFDGEVEQVPAWPSIGLGLWVARVTHEGVGVFEQTFRRGCPSPGWMMDGTPAGG